MSLIVSALLSATLCLWLNAAIAREAERLPKVGELWMSTPETAAYYRGPFHEGMRDLGYRDGTTVTLLVRYARNDPQRIPALVDELIAANVDVMFVMAAAVPIASQKAPTIPIVCPGFFDPVAEGLVASLARPGGSITGLSWQSLESSAKRVELATEIVPGLKRVAVIFADGERGSVLDANRTEKAGQRLGLRVGMFPVHDERSIEEALSAILKERPQLLIVGDSSTTIPHRKRFTGFATKARIPLISEGRPWAEAGAVLAYGVDPTDMFRRAATYVDRILRGAKPGELPIEQPRKFELLVNRTAADAIGLKVPGSILLRADEVIR